MTNNNARPSLIAPLGGAVVGLGVFLGVNFTTGHAIIPTVDSVTNISHGLSVPIRPASESVAAPPVGGAYQTVCITCHQAEGQGVAGAFPPLAGSEWIVANPEIPMRIVLLGLTGEIEVKGMKFNSVMPPPPGMTDAKIAEAITFARTHFGNHASEVTPAMVEAVHKAIAGRTASMTVAELKALQAPVAPAGTAGADAPPSATGANAVPPTAAQDEPKPAPAPPAAAQ
jgi:mono/diheme cytochrome c family protein